MKKNALLLVALTLIASQFLFAQEKAPEKKVLIDIPNLFGGSVSEIFQESEYIPLEDTKESQINRIDKIETTDKYYIILDDKRPSKILMFDKKGKFVRKIDGIPDQKTGEEGFRELWVDQDKKEIITEISSREKGIYFVYFNLDGKFLKMEKEPKDITDFKYLGNNTFAGLNRYYQENQYKHAKNLDSTRYHITIFNASKVERQYLPIDTTIISSGTDDVISSYSGVDVVNHSLLFVNTGSYKILNIGKDEISEIYNVLFPIKNSIPTDLMTNKGYQGQRFQSVKDNPDLIFGLNRICKINNWLFFSGMHWTSGWNKVMYNLQTSTALEMEKIQGDSSNGYLPLLSYPGIVGADKENIYTTVASADMFHAKEEMAAKKPTYSKLLNNYFATSSRLGNPVLIRLKLKADF